MRYAIASLLLCGCAWGQVQMYPVKIDVPAKDEPADSFPYYGGAYGEAFMCSNDGSIVRGKDGFPITNQTNEIGGAGWQCKGGHSLGCKFDPDRILIGPDGHGKYWCHLPQQ